MCSSDLSQSQRELCSLYLRLVFSTIGNGTPILFEMKDVEWNHDTQTGLWLNEDHQHRMEAPAEAHPRLPRRHVLTHSKPKPLTAHRRMLGIGRSAENHSPNNGYRGHPGFTCEGLGGR